MTGGTLNIAGTARHIGVSRKTLYNMINDGRFAVPSIPNTRPRRWSVVELNQWLNGNHPSQLTGV